MFKKRIPIVVDAERMKYPNTGMHSFCKNLVSRLVSENHPTFEIHTFGRYVFQQLNGDPAHNILPQAAHKIHFRLPSKYKLWHSTNQLSDYLPSGKHKVISTIHDLNFLYENTRTSKINRRLKKIQKKIDRADLVITISHFAKEDVCNHLKIDPNKIMVIHNGADIQTFPTHNNPIYKPKRAFIFSLGVHLPKKNLHTLPHLLVNNEMELILAGLNPDPAYISQITEAATKIGVLKRVRILGAIDDKDKYWYLKNCRCFAFPSIAEGFGIPPIEAMQLGKPVFLSTKSSLPEVGGGVAYYFDSFEPEAMQVALKDGLQDYDQSDKKPKEIERWGKKFSWHACAQKYLQAYENVMQL